MERRYFIKSALIISATGVAVTGGLFNAKFAFAEEKTSLADASKATSFDEAMELIGAKDAEESEKIVIKGPEIAENGAVVPVSITSEIADTTEIFTIISENPLPLVAKYTFGEKSKTSVKSRFKMAETSDVVAVVKADDKFYMAKSNIKVTKGGCGG